LVLWALALINGILEDQKTNVKHMTFMQKSKNDDVKMNLINIIYNFIMQNNGQKQALDLAVIIEAQLIESVEYKHCADDAKKFIRQLGELHAQKNISTSAFTGALLVCMKTNELADLYVNSQQGFFVLADLLRNYCTGNKQGTEGLKQMQSPGQVAYNVITCLWILSYHDFSLPHFADYQIGIIELVAKILDYFNQEKIVRIVCMLFNNLKTDENCLEHLSMINALNLVVKLQKKPWVDKDIEDKLEELWEYFENNYQEFSSFEKWKKQVERGALTVVGSPCHTEKFW